MRRILQLPLFFGILIFGACKSSRVHSTGPFTGKVIGSVCSQYTIQLLSGDMDPARYVKAWKNTMNDSVYNKVFAVTNYCNLDRIGLQKGDVIEFKLLPDTAKQNCVVCLIYEPTPPISNSIDVIKKN